MTKIILISLNKRSDKPNINCINCITIYYTVNTIMYIVKYIYI